MNYRTPWVCEFASYKVLSTMDKKSKCKIQVWWGIPAFSKQAFYLYSVLSAEIINIIKDLVTKEPNKKFFLECIAGKDCIEGNEI